LVSNLYIKEWGLFLIKIYKMMKKIFLLLSLVVPSFCFSQIQIDQAGDDWRSFIDSSLRIIKNRDPEKYDLIDTVCRRITMWNGDFSSCEGKVGEKGEIVISSRDIKLGYYNVSTALVHESLHLYFMKRGIELDENKEEILCYRYEIDFLRHLESPDKFLIIHAMDQIEKRMEILETNQQK